MEGQPVDRLSDAIQLARGAPLLVFLDPCGLGIPSACSSRTSFAARRGA